MCACNFPRHFSFCQQSCLGISVSARGCAQNCSSLHLSPSRIHKLDIPSLSSPAGPDLVGVLRACLLDWASDKRQQRNFWYWAVALGSQNTQWLGHSTGIWETCFQIVTLPDLEQGPELRISISQVNVLSTRLSIIVILRYLSVSIFSWEKADVA